MCEVFNCPENYGECYFCFEKKRLEELKDEGVCFDCLKEREKPEPEIVEEIEKE